MCTYYSTEYADLSNTIIPNVCLVTGGGRSGGVATVAGGGLGDVPEERGIERMQLETGG